MQPRRLTVEHRGMKAIADLPLSAPVFVELRLEDPDEGKLIAKRFVVVLVDGPEIKVFI